ncbi:MAG: N-acetyl-gamma-glutamyl-phosphate reductase [Pelagibacteraceae bacterium TMED287]|nr:MAG: N-acetyl-gamma-glutamyl-phosphate reductase [Pelagibacteraceae bacterium TMED287]
MKKINIAVIGATGYVGLELIHLLTKHPKANMKYLCAQKSIGKSVKYFDKRIKIKLPKISKVENILWKNVDLIYLSLPNGGAQKIIKKTIKYKHLKFIDLSADFRLEKKDDYKNWYKKKHLAKDLISKSIYSISEFVKNDIKKFRIISNPGCYPTSIQLPLIPLIKKKLVKSQNITIDSKSGFSGAGKNFKQKFKNKNIDSSVFAYGIKKHRHMSELDQEFKKITDTKITYTFNPHVIPSFRGILSCIYIEIKNKYTVKHLHSELLKFYKRNKFVKIMKINHPIGTGNVINTNYCEISICETRVKNKVVILSAIDNLIKGASGQAIQNMNLSYGFNEALGLI